MNKDARGVNKIDMLRRSKIDALNDPEVANAYDGLYARAIKEYGPRCLWNIDTQPTDAGMDIIAEQLMKYGDFKAWKLAALIKEKIGRAVRYPFTNVDLIETKFRSNDLYTVQPKSGGGWPSGPDIDRVIIDKIIEEYGPEGSFIP